MTGWLIAIAIAYLIGSIPNGVLIGRLKGIDIRKEGSCNIGATNVVRVLGKRLGILCFLLDVAKGAIPVIVAGIMNGAWGRPAVGTMAERLSHAEQGWWLAVALASVIGHMFSVFIGFRGGKGVATGFGSLLAMWPVLTVPCALALPLWYLTLRMTRYVSVASMTAACALPVLFLLLTSRGAAISPLDVVAQAWPPLAVTAALAILVGWRHRANIRRVLSGEEPRAFQPAAGDGATTPPRSPEAR